MRQSCGRLDPTDGVDEHTSNGMADIFVTKLNVDGSYAWTRTMGGPGTDVGSGVVVDAQGAVLIAGSFHETVDFDPTDGVDEHIAVDDPGTAASDPNAFVTRLNADGSYG